MVVALLLANLAFWGYVVWASSASAEVYRRLAGYAGLPGARRRGPGSVIARAMAGLLQRRGAGSPALSGWGAYSASELQAAGVDPRRVDLARYGMAASGIAGGLLLGAVAGDVAVGLLFGAIAGAAGMVYPRIRATSRLQARRRQVLRDLPEVLELLAVAMAAGLGFDQAMRTVSSQFRGPLAEAMARYCDEVALGRPSAEAIHRMAERCGAEEVRQFAAQVVMSRRYGASMVDVIRTQADYMRRITRARQKEAVSRASVQMLFPLVLCIFPTIFLLTLGPLLLKLIRSGIFSG